MGVGIDGPPNQYPAGLDFDYSVWTPGTRLSIVNVNWNNDYRDVVRFADRNALNNYINNLASAGVSIDKMTYAKPGQDIYLGIPYNRLNRFNYIRASNPLMPITGDIQKDFYYFILECEYVNPTTTRLRLQLDVWQTYIYDVSVGNCYVQRGHIGIANQNAFNNYGRDYLTVPEGMDIGSEYQQIARKSNTVIMNPALAGDGSPADDLINGDILVVTTVDFATSGGTADAPVLNTATGSVINGLPSGADFWYFQDIATFQTFMAAYAETPWMTQGIISTTLVPSIRRYTPDALSPPTNGHKISNLWSLPVKHSMFPNWRDNLISQIPSRYQGLKKLFTFPYMAIEMTTWTGNPAILKPESWNNPDALVMERASFMPPNQRAEFYPRGYNAVPGAAVDNQWDFTDSQIAAISDPTLRAAMTDTGDDSGDYLDMIVQIGNFPQLPVVNNMAIGYLAANKNQIAYGFQSADWSQQRALAGAQAAYDISSGAMRQRSESSNIDRYAAITSTATQNQLANAQAAVGAIGSFAKGAAGGAAFGGTPEAMGAGAAIGGIDAVTGALSAGQQINANNQNLANMQSTSQQQAANDNTQTALARDTNVNLARFAARGDYANEIAGINAKVRDAALIQPSVSGQFAGESINIETNKLEMSLRFKMIDRANMAKVCEYWLRYGYAIDRFIRPPQDLHVMNKFTYWKMSETYITAAMIPEGHKQAIRGIMEKGFTNWKNPADIGQIDTADNTPLAGISY